MKAVELILSMLSKAPMSYVPKYKRIMMMMILCDVANSTRITEFDG